MSAADDATVARLFAARGSSLSFQAYKLTRDDVKGDVWATDGAAISALTVGFQVGQSEDRGVAEGAQFIHVQASPFVAAGKELTPSYRVTLPAGGEHQLAEEVRKFLPDLAGDPSYYIAEILTGGAGG